MNRFELEARVKDLGFTYRHHQAMSGSEYITINGQKYRLSDHFQPSHYQVRNYIDCNSNEQIFELAVENYKKSLEVNTTDEFLYCEKSDGFYANPNYTK